MRGKIDIKTCCCSQLGMAQNKDFGNNYGNKAFKYGLCEIC